MKKETKDPALLTFSEALELLSTYKEGKKLRIHTYTGESSFVAGCNVDFSDIKKRLKASTKICLAEKMMKAVGHGVVFLDPKYNQFMFLNTDKEKLEAIHKQRKTGK